MQSSSKFWREVIPEKGIYIASFLLLFAIGTMGGKAVGTFILDRLTQTPNPEFSVGSALNNGQQNFLLIGVDTFKTSSTKLESIWLLITMSSSSELTLIPIYPSGIRNSEDDENIYADTFGLTADLNPREAFLTHLREKTWWHNFIMMDKQGIGKFVELLNQSSRGNTALRADLVNDEFQRKLQDFSFPLKEQVIQMVSICEQAQHLPNQMEIIQLIKNLKPQMITDVNWEAIERKYREVQQNEFRIKCEFPTLNLDVP